MVVANKRILVVDDEAIVRHSCELALTDAGYAVSTVRSGREAIQACRNERFDVVFTDIRMPDMDGLEVSRVLSGEFPDLPVVIITGYPSPESAERARSYGVFDYIEKPLSPERLSAATAEALAHAPQRMVGASPAPAPEPVTPAVAVRPVAEVARAAAPAASDMGLLKGLALVAAAPFIGLAYVVFLPFIGFAMLFAALGLSLAKKPG
jgi:DNA-binding NtrC family response regulator